MPIRILLADDHSMFRQMLRGVLSSKGNAFAIVGEAADGPETLNLVAHCHPDLLLLDYKMPCMDRLSTFCKKVASRSPNTRILLLSGFAEEGIALEAAVGGVKGYVLKAGPVADLLTAIVIVHSGGTWADANLPPQMFHIFLHQRGRRAYKLGKLSRQEMKVLCLLAGGMSNKEIGANLYISQKTVKNHFTHVFAKLGVVGRQQAVRRFLPKKKSAQRK